MMDKKKFLLFLCLLLLLLLPLTILGAHSLVFNLSEKSHNTFELGSISSEINDLSIQDNNFIVTNTSNVNTFIRVAMTINCRSIDGQYYGDAPIKNEDYQLNINSSSWFQGSDGYYYYKNKLSPTQNTESLIQSIDILDEDAIPSGYQLVIDMSASAIQANPLNAVTEAWTIVEYKNGELIPKQ